MKCYHYYVTNRNVSNTFYNTKTTSETDTVFRIINKKHEDFNVKPVHHNVEVIPVLEMVYHASDLYTMSSNGIKCNILHFVA